MTASTPATTTLTWLRRPPLTTPPPWRSTLALSVLTLALSSPALAADPPPRAASASAGAAPKAMGTDGADRFERERRACTDGSSPQQRDACLKEVGAAQAEAKRNGLGNGEDTKTRAANAADRCKAVAAADRDACLRMARGEGTSSGSVGGGGVVREIVTPVPAASAGTR